MLLVLLLLAPVLARPSQADGEASARWRCEPETVAVGEPFELVLELEHVASLSARELAPAKLALDPSWVVLSAEPPASTTSTDGRLATRCAWRVVSLEPGERALADALAGVSLGERVTKIQLGDAKVSVHGLLAEGEDAPRPAREFPDDFAAGASEARASRAALWLALGAVVVAGAVAFAYFRQRARRRQAAPRATPIERLAELERGLDEGRGAERCYALTRLLREAGDELRNKPRGGLTDAEWLAEVHTSLEIPRGVVTDLTAVFERAERVKYGGETPTTCVALEGLVGGGVRA
jgi:hypothetical protein